MSAIGDRLDQLQAQVEELQQQLAAATADSLAPNYLTLDAEGHVSADFSGHISATGVDLPEAGSGNMDQIAAIDWLDASAIARSFIQAYAGGVPFFHGLRLACQPDANDYAYIDARVEPNSSSSNIGVSAGASNGKGAVATILDCDGDSSFVFEPTWTNWAPAVSSSGGAIGAYNATGQYLKINKSLTAFQFNVELTNIGTAGGELWIAAPAGFAQNASNYSMGLVRETAITGHIGTTYCPTGAPMIHVNATSLDGGTIWVNGYQWQGLALIGGTWA